MHNLVSGNTTDTSASGEGRHHERANSGFGGEGFHSSGSGGASGGYQTKSSAGGSGGGPPGRFGSGGRGGGGGGGRGSFWDDVLFRGQRAQMDHHRGRSTGVGANRGGGGGVGSSFGDRDEGGNVSNGGGSFSSGSGGVSPREGGSPRDGGDSIPGPPVRAASENIPTLAHADLFWRSAVVALVLAATNPGSVGRQLWETSPTMRCLMQVLLLLLLSLNTILFAS